jgi:hypothetical protein
MKKLSNVLTHYFTKLRRTAQLPTSTGSQLTVKRPYYLKYIDN